MTVFLDSSSRQAAHHAAEELRGWGRGRQGLGVALIYGPVSAEDRLYHSKCPVEQRSVTALGEALEEIGTQWSVLDPTQPDFIRELVSYDVALSNLHGPFGEDGRLQGLLDYLRVPYCGSGVQASAVAADKVLCKRVMLTLGVPTPGWRLWSGGPVNWGSQAVMVKPPFGGSSVGMSLVRDAADLPRALAGAAVESGGEVLVEDYIIGTPVTVGMLELPGGSVMIFPPLTTEATEAEFYDADTKLDPDSRGTVAVRAAELEPVALNRIARDTRTLWDGIGLRGSARIDFIVTDDGGAYVLEVNSTPGMSRDSNFAVGAAMVGLTHTDCVLAMLHEALARPPYDVPLPTPVFSSITATREAIVLP
ncbi:ATP-grasp domain-containing protein [Streptomyces mobaraensis NBRC 13819 = DSM 40847]|uniref:D-alanine--D-alanine ligase n=1 Tax=Streptomyces mobaraensis (strain ATCC 29032 / DSM 40847 / JCM 4168 / NBRC 13819 / NCIMB 11159 / IPCR 16-22) TaxID=1223523 RepID=M3CB42_STRM1|nr:ATP-grasp domain-containing protein [Streptomyces mobaraensis]EMF01272.1 D-alanine--D-alanine ligase [Streptomyces mobaraensis NBRC 13819 = DSM 40847]QTT76587.1 ATP-grasp domain-containing protein [Streptomyces mobaraensis NBRC 13819 = DSM 40847]